MRTYGIAYCIRFGARDSTYRIDGGYCYSDGNMGFISLPRSWTFDWPVVDRHQFYKYGASQIQGLLGGIADDWQRARSDSIERAIGDVLTLLICEILDSEHTNVAQKIYILGPALHKCIGRIASLRPPIGISIAWICPIPFPAWIVEGANDPVIVPSMNATEDLLWEEEPLVLTRAGNAITERRRSAIQLLNLWSSEEDPWAKIHDDEFSLTLWDALLPKELVLASGQVHLHSLQPYANRSLQSRLEDLQDEWIGHRERYRVLEREESIEVEGLPGWPIEWTP